MHQVAMSSARFNGADLGIRRQWLPLFDAYGVDLVVAGHEHLFERTFPVRGVLPGSPLLTPAPRGDDPIEIDATSGTVHVTIGGGGHPSSAQAAGLPEPPEGRVIVGVGPGSPQSQRKAIIATEPAPWSAYRDTQLPFGFAAFEVTPLEPDGSTSITATYYTAAAGSPNYAPRDSFVLRKPVRAGRADQAGQPRRRVPVRALQSS